MEERNTSQTQSNTIESAAANDLRPYSEAVVDTALVSLLESSESFRTWFLQRVVANDGMPAPAVAFRGARRSVYHVNGESDVVAEWRGTDGDVVVLVENKLSVGFQPNQGGRYAERARALAESGAAAVRTVLLAPQQYLRAANPEARKFDVWLPLEEVIEAARLRGCNQEAEVLAGAVQRVAEGGALGSKGLYPTVHAAIAAECERRGQGFRITNNATDWVFLTHPTCQVGMRFRYRIKDRIAEIVFFPAFKGDREALLARVAPPFGPDRSGGDRFVRLPPLNTTADAEEFSDADAALVADALERLLEWWGSVSNA